MRVRLADPFATNHYYFERLGREEGVQLVCVSLRLRLILPCDGMTGPLKLDKQIAISRIGTKKQVRSFGRLLPFELFLSVFLNDPRKCLIRTH